ncbi:LysR family substrate-binding domain-containing protein, partial [Tsukamurella soli]|uniref:LysR family substrate-binding domain-containing protein n=1 Tax=Tsukamurella soli TaxID=644556 RepID=UPI0031E795D6
NLAPARLAADVDEARRIHRGESGRLDVWMVSSAAAEVGRRTRALIAVRPDVRVTVTEGHTADVLAAVRRGAADVGVVRDPDPDPRLRYRTVIEERFVALVPDDGAPDGPVDVRELAQRPLVLYPRAAGATAYEANLRPFRDAGVVPRIAHEVSHWTTIAHLVAAGLGVTVAPLSAAGTLPPGVRRRELRDVTARSAIVTVSADAESPLAAAFAAA